ncbi:MAG: GerMN domain-containing protein [Schaedlerella sp.]|nr:GerMN domain-containing protein [Schaedlerella sp.]
MKKKRFLSLILCLLCLILCVTACEKRTDVSDDEEYIYCLNGDKTGLIKVEYDFPVANTQDLARAVLRELARPVEEIEYVQPIPEEIKVESCKVDGIIAVVDFNSAYYDLSNLDEKLLRAAVVQSLLEIDEIIGVQFTVEGERLKLEDGTVVGVMNQNDFVQNTNTALNEYRTTTLTLYFSNEAGDGLTWEKREVKYTSNETQEKLIVENLLSGPTKTGAYPTINPQTTLLSVTIKDDICYVNFDSDFLNRVYDVKPEVIIYSVVNSLIAGTDIYKVQITVNGEKEVKFEDTVDLSKPFEADYSYIK